MGSGTETPMTRLSGGPSDHTDEEWISPGMRESLTPPASTATLPENTQEVTIEAESKIREPPIHHQTSPVPMQGARLQRPL